jgi:predicted metalloprotease with PDZ domain
MPYDSIVATMLELGGAPLRALYAGAIAGAGPLPAAELLNAAGLELVTREVEELTLGAVLVPDSGGGLVFRDVEPQSIAGRMGLRAGDRLLEVNHLPVSTDNVLPLMAVLADLRSGVRVGEEVRVRVRRGAGEVELTGTLQPWTREVRALVEDPSAAPGQVAIRETLFAPPTAAPLPPSAGGGS